MIQKKLPFLAKTLGVYYKKFVETKEETLTYFKKVINCTDTQDNDGAVIKEIIGNDGKTYKKLRNKEDTI
ncbi:MAG: Sec-independent protein translocase subunit TatB [Ehrlichia sp.]